MVLVSIVHLRGEGEEGGGGGREKGEERGRREGGKGKEN